MEGLRSGGVGLVEGLWSGGVVGVIRSGESMLLFKSVFSSVAPSVRQVADYSVVDIMRRTSFESFDEKSPNTRR